MKPNGIGGDGGPKEKVDIPPEAEADAGLPSSGKYDVSGTVLNNFGFLAGFGILPILSAS